MSVCFNRVQTTTNICLTANHMHITARVYHCTHAPHSFVRNSMIRSVNDTSAAPPLADSPMSRGCSVLLLLYMPLLVQPEGQGKYEWMDGSSYDGGMEGNCCPAQQHLAPQLLLRVFNLAVSSPTFAASSNSHVQRVAQKEHHPLLMSS